MLEAFVTKIQSLAESAFGMDSQRIPGFPEKVIVRQGKDFTIMDIPPGRRASEVYGLEDLLTVAGDTELCVNPEVYYGAQLITVLLDREDRRDRITMPLTPSQRMVSLQRMADPSHQSQSYTPAQVVKWLRFDMAGAVPASTVAAFRRLNFIRSSDGGSTIEHGRESLGRSVEAAVQQADDIPETITATLPAFINPGLRLLTTVSIDIGVYVDVNREAIELCVQADEVQGAIDAACGDIGRELKANLADIPVYLGSPDKQN